MIEGITAKIGTLCFVLINSVLLNLSVRLDLVFAVLLRSAYTGIR